MITKLSTRTLTLILAFGLTCLIVGLTLWVLTQTGMIGYYHGLNSGITFGHWGGVEVSGTPRLFRCDGQC